MKSTIVPAQVTTVEDKITGNLNFAQMLLLTTPVFLSGAIFAFIPPFMSLRSYKLIVCAVVAVICVLLSIRIKGKIVLVWVGIIGRYNARPRWHVFNKNDLYLRPLPLEPPKEAKTKETANKSQKQMITSLSVDKLIQAERLAERLEFQTTKKGGLRVRIQESE